MGQGCEWVVSITGTGAAGDGSERLSGIFDLAFRPHM
jgi:hypothetical protein